MKPPSAPRPALKITTLFRIFTLFALVAGPACGGPDQAEVREVKKWNSYVELNNDMTTRFFQPLELYFRAFGRTAEYRPAAEHHDLVNFVSSLTSTEDFGESIKTSLLAASAADTDLDGAARKMLPHLAELWSLLSQSRDYHAAQAYLKDGHARAADLHARLQAAHTLFSPAYQEFSRLLHKRDAERRKADIEAMINQKLRLKPAMLRAVDAAQNMQDYLNAQDNTPETILNLEPAAFIALFNEYSRAGDEFLLLDIEEGDFLKEGLKEEPNDFRLRLQEVSESARPILAYCQGIQNGEAATSTKLVDLEIFSINIAKMVDSYNLTIR